MLEKCIAGDFIAIAGEMHRFPASNENTDTPLQLRCGGYNNPNPRSWLGVLNTTLCDKSELSVTSGRLVVFSGYSDFLYQ